MRNLNIDKLYKEREIYLTPELKKAFLNEEYSFAIGDAIILANVTEEKEKNELINIVTAVLLGVFSPNEFKTQLSQRTKISKQKIEIIDTIIQQKIFKPLNDELEKIKILVPQPALQPTNPKLEKETPKIIPKIESVSGSFVTPEIQKEEKIAPEEKFIPEEKIEKISEKTEEQREEKLFFFNKKSLQSKSKLWEVMSKKTSPPKIVEVMKKIHPSVKKQPLTPEKKQIPEEKKDKPSLSVSQIKFGGNGTFIPEEEKNFSSSPLKKPSFLDVKIKEIKKKEEPALPSKPIRYPQYEPKKPFGESS